MILWENEGDLWFYDWLKELKIMKYYSILNTSILNTYRNGKYFNCLLQILQQIKKEFIRTIFKK